MATALATRITDLQTAVERQRKLIHAQTAQIEKQQMALDVQFARIADIQAELVLVKATVRHAAPAFAATLIGPQPRRAGSLRLSRPRLTVSPSGRRFAMAFAASSLAHETPLETLLVKKMVALPAHAAAARNR
jgi:hypothetical protein